MGAGFRNVLERKGAWGPAGKVRDCRGSEENQPVEVTEDSDRPGRAQVAEVCVSERLGTTSQDGHTPEELGAGVGAGAGLAGLDSGEAPPTGLGPRKAAWGSGPAQARGHCAGGKAR